MESSNLIGQTLLNRFRVDSFVAAGGMGAVYRVWDLHRSAYLAMKVLHPELAEDVSAYRRFKREADDLRNLAHPNIVPFYGLYEDRGLSFLLEAFVSGPSLSDILRQRQGQPLPLIDALSYLRALCAALGYAHSQGVIHCDVKPGNVMIDSSGIIYLTDFGISRHAESTTTTRSIIGTPAYMAPEQIRGDDLTPAVDIYALGVMLFEMLTGQRPFSGNEPRLENAGNTLGERTRAAHLLLNPPDPRSINPSISPGLAWVLLRALAKDPGQRFLNTNELFNAAADASGLAYIPDRVAPFAGTIPFGQAPVYPSPQPTPAYNWQPGGYPSQPATPYGNAVPEPAVPRGMQWKTLASVFAATVLLVGLGIGALFVFRRQPPATAPTPSQPPQTRVVVTPTGLTPVRATDTLKPATVTPPRASNTNTPPAPSGDRITSPKDGMTLIRIPAGAFIMGSNSSPWNFEAPQHTVRLNEFWIDETEITNALFRAFVDQSGYRTQAENAGHGWVTDGTNYVDTNGADWRHPLGPGSSIDGKDKYPVVQVSWGDAKAYCEWAGRRLLTEAEWEKAARSEDGRLYPWGNKTDCSRANYAGKPGMAACTGGLTPVDAYPTGASPYGVLDMTGNAWEWVNDWWQSNYYSVSPAENPTGPATGQKRVHRGGSWYNFDLQAQASYRYPNDPDWTFNSVGIRCGLTP